VTQRRPSDEPFERGHVIWHEGLFRGSGRPWLVLTDDRHPFHGEEYVVAGITTTQREGSITLTDEDWTIGGLPRVSYVSPWFLTTLKHAEIERGIGALVDETVTDVAAQVVGYFEEDSTESTQPRSDRS
jgi:mRNA-degrading endonuclease toxin of MazEF toxin-antitoxin module